MTESKSLNQDKNNSSTPLLIIGGGITGITTAVEAAEAGLSSLLVDKKPYLGGNAIGMNRYFPKMCPPYCGMEINFRRIKQNPLINYQVSTQVTAIEKTDEGYTVELEQDPEYVNDHCTLCGLCTEVCDSVHPDPFNQHMTSMKVIDLPHSLAFPERYYLDEGFCHKPGCTKCQDACTYGAIDLMAQAEKKSIDVKGIVIATGWQSFNPVDLAEYNYGRHPDILTNTMMERISAPNGPTLGKIRCQEQGQAPKKIAFVQCAGSRDQRHLPYCSGVCCSASLKQALHAAEVLPEVEISIHYIDLRVSGRNEDFLRKVEAHPRIKLVKGKVTQVKHDAEKPGLSLTAEHIDQGKKEVMQADMVVLALGLVPDEAPIADLLPERRSYCDYYSLPDGIQLAGCALSPMDISTSVKSGTSAALLGMDVASLKHKV